MAEESRITNVEGELGVASEVTMRKLLEQMQKMAKASGRDPSSQEAKVRQTLIKGKLGEIKVVEDTTKSVDGFGSALTMSSKLIAGGLTKTLYGLANLTGKVTNSTYNMSKALVLGSDNLEDFATHIPIVGRSLSGLAGELDRSISSYRQLTAVGASFNNSLFEMYDASIRSAMSFEAFSELVLENSNRLNLFAGTVSSGAREIGRLSREMRQGDTANALFNMGFTISDISESLINYTQLQARTTGRRIRDEQTLIQGTRTYLEEINKLAKITGLNRKEQEQILLQNMQEANINMLRMKAAERGEDYEKRFDASLVYFTTKFPKSADAFKDMMDGLITSPEAAKLSAAMPGLLELATAAGKGEVSIAELDSELRRLAPSMSRLVEGLGPAAVGPMIEAGYGVVFDFYTAMKEYQASSFDPDAAAAEAKKREAVTGALTAFSNLIDQVRTGLSEAFIDSGFFENMTTFVNKTFTTEKVDKFSNDVAAFMNALIKDPSGTIDEMFQNMKTYLYDAIYGEIANVPGDGMTEVFRQGGLIQTLRDGFTALFKDDGVLETLKNEIANMTGSFVKGFSDFWNSPESNKLRDEISGMFSTVAEKIFREFILLMDKYTPFFGRAAAQIKMENDPEFARFLNMKPEEIKAEIKTLRTQILDIMRKQTQLDENSPEWAELADESRKKADIVNTLEAYLQNLRKIGYSRGSNGFVDFGSGTPAILHGREAVVPEDSEMGQLLQLASLNGFGWGNANPPVSQGSRFRPLTRGQGTVINQEGPPKWMGGSPRPTPNFLRGLMRGLIFGPISLGAKIGFFSDINPGIQDRPRGFEDPFRSMRPQNPAGLVPPTDPDSSAFIKENAMDTSARAMVLADILLGKLKSVSNLAPTTSARPLPRPSVPEIRLPEELDPKGFGDTGVNRVSPSTLQAPVIDSIENLNNSITSFEESSNRTGNNNTELQKQLNTIMNDIKSALVEVRDINKRIETNTRSLGTNVSSGRVTALR